MSKEPILVPCGDRLIVEKLDMGERKSQGGLVLPSAKANESHYGVAARVIMAGERCTFVNAGDFVFIQPIVGYTIETPVGDRVVIEEKNVLCRVEHQ